MSQDPLKTDADLTKWLNDLAHAPQGQVASTALFEALYADIKRAARAAMHHERAEHTLSATALVNEAWMRMAEQTRTDWQSRQHFVAVAATMMRRILVNHEMARRTDKRFAELVPLTLSGLGSAEPAQNQADVVAVHDALLAFEAIDARAAQVVELKFFGGLENEEIADALGISTATVKRDWTFAKAWLHTAMKNT